jgi:hypothetical protein
MKTYIVYLNGMEVGYIVAGGHNQAEKKAKKKYKTENVSVVYTEI